MSSPHGAVRDGSLGGYAPRRHEDPDWDIDERHVGFSMLVENSLERLTGLQIKDNDPLNGGDDQSWLLWRAKSQADRLISSFSPAFSAVVTDARKDSASMLPLYARGQADVRYERKVPLAGIETPLGTRYHKGQTGHVSAGMSEYSQQDIFHADWLNTLTAVNTTVGDQAISTVLSDLDDTGSLHPTRNSPLHRLLSVVSINNLTNVPDRGTQPRGGANGERGTTIGLNLRGNGGNDPTPHALPFIDNEQRAIGLGAFYDGGGPFIVDRGQSACQHDHGTDDLGRTVRPLHRAPGNGGASR